MTERLAGLPVVPRRKALVPCRSMLYLQHTPRFLSGALLLAACASGRSRPTSAPGPVLFLPSSGCGDGALRPPPWRSSDTLTAAYARSRPDAALAYLTRHAERGEPADSETTVRLAQVRAAAGLRFGMPRGDPQARPWDAAQLYDWAQHILRSGWPPGMNAWAIQGQYLVLGVGSTSALDGFLAFLEQKDVPCGLVRFMVLGPASVAAAGAPPNPWLRFDGPSGLAAPPGQW